MALRFGQWELKKGETYKFSVNGNSAGAAIGAKLYVEIYNRRFRLTTCRLLAIQMLLSQSHSRPWPMANIEYIRITTGGFSGSDSQLV